LATSASTRYQNEKKAIMAAPVAMRLRREIFNAMTTSHRVSVPRMRVVGALLLALRRPGLTFDIEPLLGTLRAEASRWPCSWIVS
jgi:hypothetical protein